MEYVHESQYYIDVHDIRTIEDCLSMYLGMRRDYEGHRKDKDFEKFTDEKFKDEVNKVCSYATNVIKGIRFRDKAKTIEKWMTHDRELQEKYDNAIPPEHIFCIECDSPMAVHSKDLLGLDDEKSQVLYMFECTKCQKRRTIYEDGSEWDRKPPICPECGAALKDDTEYKNEVMTTKYVCSQCHYKKTDTYDFKKSGEETKKRGEHNKELLEKYRSEFCYTEKQGQEFWQSMDSIKQLMDDLKAKETKEADPVYQKAKQLKIVKAASLKELIQKAIEKEGYNDLQFDKPEISQYVIIGFSVNDIRDDRKEYDSTNQLKKFLNKTLDDTNWRLMSDGISYRLGILTGRLKAYENDEDLMKLVK